MRSPWITRAAAVLVGALTVLVGAAPASAHVKVTADNPQAGAVNVTLTFTGAAESDSSGIVSERVVLPTGIAPTDVRLASAPPGWTFTAAADGYTVAGPALPVGTDAVHSVVVAQLPPTATELVFRLVESYGDGKVSRWIETPEAGKPEPENPAPVLKLTPAAAPVPSATTAAPTSAPATSAPATSATAPDEPTPTASSETDGAPVVWIAIAVIVAAAAAVAGVFLVRRRRPGTADS